MRLILELVGWLNQIALSSAGGLHPIFWRPEWNKKWSIRENSCFLCLPVFELEHQLFLHSDLDWTVALLVKNPPAIRETWVRSLDWDDSLEEGMAIHSSILAWGIPWTEEPGELQSLGLQKVRLNWVTNVHTQWRSNSSVAAGLLCKLLDMRSQSGQCCLGNTHL